MKTSATSRSNPSTTRRENSSRLVSIYCQFFRFSITVFVYAGKMTINTKLEKSLKVLIISEHGNMESCSLLKKVNLEEFIEENTLELEEDEDKTKGSFSFSTPSS